MYSHISVQTYASSALVIHLTLIFDLLTSESGLATEYVWSNFLLRAQTDRQTDRTLITWLMQHIYQQVYLLTPIDHATLLHVKSTISHCPPSFITSQRVSVDSKTATQIKKCRLLPHIWTIMLKLHLVDLLSICYTANFATNSDKSNGWSLGLSLSVALSAIGAMNSNPS